ncbi:hypothetical protein [Cellulomonas chengniuliangii]|uniref:Uncharacterized protein n=1 Tax=Cellulomonas chengniuliangii TaxID=2968084 RepID=A0ABY5L4G0_9CELL|nr:hypothetical protein [Cellulomonas chengniuliangii]MCC2308305.1 hypothetical protein [Cellulomonas chengniuliangii]UUI76689.1 hypothetical protein NP064_07360 [Cellulomonas chengniuliangii]
MPPLEGAVRAEGDRDPSVVREHGADGRRVAVLETGEDGSGRSQGAALPR